MEKYGLTQVGFAEWVDLSPQYINDLLLKRHGCGAGGARKMQTATKGELTIQELVTWYPTPESASKRKRKAC